MTAHGEALDAAIELNGGLGGGAPLSWRGEVSRLMLDSPDLAPLRLREPAKVEYVDGNLSIGRACLAQENASLCADVATQQNGALRASYSFDRVPLGLANALAPEALPGRLRGEVAGEGQLRGEADGRWFGEARIASASAEMVPGGDGEDEVA